MKIDLFQIKIVKTFLTCNTAKQISLQDVPDYVPDSVPDHIPDYVPDSIPDYVPDYIPDYMPV